MSKKIKRTGCTLMSILLAQGLFPNINAAGGDTNSESKGLNMNELLIVSKYFKNSKDFVNSTMTSKKYETIIDGLHYNPVEVTPETVKHFTNLQTLHIYDVRNLVDHDGYRKLTLDELEKTIKERYAEVDKRIHKYVIWTNDQSLLSKKEYHNLEFKDNKGYVHYYIDKSKENSDIKFDIDSLYRNSIFAGKSGDCPVKELFIEGDVESINMLEICNGGYGLKTIHIAPGIKHIGNLKISGSARKIDIEGENVQIDSTNGNILPSGKDLSIGAVNVNFNTDHFGGRNTVTVNVGSVKKDELFIKEDISDKNKALLFACKNGQLNAVKYLLEHGADVNAKDRNDNTPLSSAAERGNLELVKYLVDHGADVNAGNGWALENAARSGNLELVKYLVDHGADVNADNGWALMGAAEKGHLDIVKYLVEHGADVNARNYSSTPLGNAIEKGHLDIVKYLVEHGADVNAEYRDNFCREQTALMNAASIGNLEIVKYLVEHGADVNKGDALGNAAGSGNLELVKYLVEEKGADVNAFDDDYETPLLTNAASSGNLELVKYLVEKGANVNARNSDGRIPIFYAAENGHTEIAKYLIDHGADVKYREGDEGSYEDNILGIAAENGHTEIVRMLIEAGADIEATDEHRLYCHKTALIRAAEHGHVETVKLLIEKGANINHFNDDGEGGDPGTALSYAARNVDMKMVNLLLEHGAEIVGGDEDYTFTALADAARSGNLELVKYLVEEKGADVNARNYSGGTPLGNPLGNAIKKGHLDIVKYLVEEKGADVNAKGEYGTTLLGNAIKKGHWDIVKYLVEHGADVNAADEDGKTPLSIAASSGNLELVKYLVEEKGADVNAKYRDIFGKEQTALMNAAERGHTEIAKYLKEHGAIE